MERPCSTDSEADESLLRRDISLRSVVIGLALIPVNSIWIAYIEEVWLLAQPTSLSLFYNAIFVILVLLALNVLLGKLRPQWRFAPSEIIVIYTMVSLSSAVMGLDMIEILVPILSHLHRFAPLEGRYQEIMTHLPDWLVVRDPVALQSAYIGQESPYAWRNFGPWLEPVAWWSAFILALCAVMWGLLLIFRKQWVENEKLSYPILQLPLALATEPQSLFGNRLFIAGALIAGSINIVNGIHYLIPNVPHIPVVQIINLQQFFPDRPWADMGGTWVSFYPFAIGLCFFMPTDLAFSCWFFYIFWKAQRVLAAHVGIHGMPGFPYVAEQTSGAYFAIAFTALWVTRHHFARCWRILTGNSSVEDATPWERREVRLAALFILGGSGFLLYFCLKAGMALPIVLAFFGMYFLISVAVTRMRAELGPPSHDLHYTGPRLQISRFIGMTEMRKHYPKDMVMFGFLNFINRAYRCHPMPHGLEGFRAAERLKLNNARYLAAMIAALVLGTICGFWSVIYVFNRFGASGTTLGPTELFGREAWEEVNRWFTMPEPHIMAPTYAIGVGLVFALGLSSLRMVLSWWPFHPVGYAISGSWSMDQLWSSIMAAWVVKVLLLKYGGINAYRPATPFFMGLIVGDFVMGSFWSFYGILTEQQVYHFWPY